MPFESFRLDQIAHDLVRDYYQDRGARQQVYKMRTATAYGLERFWGEQLRLQGREAEYWSATWNKFVEIISTQAGMSIPNENINNNDPQAIRRFAEHLWDGERFPLEQRKVALAILIQLCDCMVWWTQRYKKLVVGDDEDV